MKGKQLIMSAVTQGFIAVLLLVILTCQSWGQTPLDNKVHLSPPETEAHYVPDEILVKFKHGIPKERKDTLHTKHGSKNVREFEQLRIHHVKLKKGLSIEDAIKGYEAAPDVEFAEPNYIRYLQITTPNDTYFTQQWALHNIGQLGGTLDADIDATEAWDMGTGNSNIVIAVIDSGVDWNHPDLAANIWNNPAETNCADGLDNDGNGYIDDCKGWNFVGDNTNPMDDDGHGTYVAGIIGALGNNGTGVAGVMWNPKLMPLKFLGSDGSGTVADEIAAIIYAADNGADIINLSIGGFDYSASEKNAIDYAYSNGVVIVAAAGNENTSSKSYPAAFDNVIAVAATDQNDARASFSNYGSWIDVSAPGVDIFSTVLDDTYGYGSGTSVASPFVASMAGLVLSQHPEFSNAEVVRRITNTTDDINTPGFDTYTGHGRINARQAVMINAWITGPTVGSIVSGTVSLTGIATSTNFSYYQVEFGLSYTPSTWTQIESATYTPVTNGILSAWDTTGIPDGNYTLRLTVQNTDGSSYIDSKVVTVRNNGGRIVFTSDRDGNSEIYIMNADGSNQTRLTTDTADDIYPSLSPDGSRIVFTSYRDGNAEIYVMNVDGFSQTRLTNNSAYDLAPVFSPDGSKIAFFSNQAGNYDIYVMNADGTNLTALTSYVDYDMYPKWSPDGSKLIFSSTALYGDRNVFEMDADGNNVTALTTNAAFDSYPVYSPLGNNIVFVSNRGNADFYNFDIYMMNMDGNNQSRLTTGTNEESHPSWSPDGAKITYDSNQSGNYHIYTMNSDGTNQIKLTNSGNNIDPSWGPSIPDESPPTGTIAINAGAANTNSTSVTLTLSCSDYGSGCSQMQFSNDNATYSIAEAYATTKSWTLTTGDETKTVYVKFKDYDGNWSDVYSDTILLDTTAPSTSASPSGGAYTSAQNVTLTCSDRSSSGCAVIYYTTDGSTPTISSSVYSDALNISSNTTLRFFARDNAGNAENISTEMYTIDTIAPTTTPSPPGGTYNTNLIVTLTTDESATIYYTTDGTTPTVSSSVYLNPIIMTAITTLKFFAEDLAGNSEAVKTQIYTIDTTPPNCSITSSASDTWTNSMTVDSGSVLDSSLALDSNNKSHISYYDNTNADLKYATNSSGAWVVSTIDSSGSVGRYSSIAVDSNNKVHISYFDATNSDLKYATNASGSWIMSSIDSSGSVGYYTSLAIDTNNKVHVSYIDVSNYDLKYATNVSGSWVTSAIDSAGSIWLNTSIAVDSNNKVHISYYDSLPNGDLKYATNLSGTWQTSTVDSSGDVGQTTSIAMDSNNKVHISYYDATNNDLKYATNVSGSWVTEILDSNGGGGTSIAVDSNSKIHILYYVSGDSKYITNLSGSWVKRWVPIGGQTSIAIDANNKAHIAVISGGNGLYYATNALGPWLTRSVDTVGNVGEYNSMALDLNNLAHITYYDSTNGDLKYATNLSGAWQTAIVDSSGNVGQYTSIAMDSNNKAHISYYDATSFDLKYATNATGSWVTTTVDSSGDVGQFTAIAIDSNNKAHISYYDATNLDLKYATNATGSWVTTTVDSIGYVGRYTSIALDSNNKVHISYLDLTNWDLKYTTNASGTWVISTIDSTGSVGFYTSIAVDSQNRVHIGYYGSSGNWYLKYALYSSGVWSIQTVDVVDAPWPSLVVDSNDKVHISYRYGTFGLLKYATNSLGSWTNVTLDDKGYVGTRTSIAIDSANKAHIAYYDTTNADLIVTTNSLCDTNPTTAAIVINSAAEYTATASVNLTISASDLDGVAEMRFSNTSSYSGWSTWETYSIAKVWSLSSGDGTKTVYAQFKDNNGIQSKVYNDTINLDTTPPTGNIIIASEGFTSTIESANSVGSDTSVALDTNNKVHISYYDATNYDLKYATNTSGSWATYTIDSAGNVGSNTSIALDLNNKVHISYLDYTNYDLKYATNASGSWTIYRIDSTGAVGYYTSIALDSNNKVHISYYDNTNGDLKYVSNVSGSWVVSTIDATGYVGQYTSLALDTNNKVHISYYDATNYDLKYATNVSGSWVISTIDSTGTVGYYTSIALDSNNKVHISYSGAGLKYATNATGSWVTSSIDSTGSYTSLAIDTNNKVHISYCDSTNYDLKYATNVSGSWTKYAVDSIGSVGSYSSIASDSNNKAHISYFDSTNWDLKYSFVSERSYSNSDSVALTLSCVDSVSGCSQMQFSNDNTNWSTPETFVAGKSWILSSGEGSKTVYVKFKDIAGNWSNALSDTITIDTASPSTTASPSGGVYNSEQSVTLTCNDGTGSDCNNIYYTTDGSTPTTSSSVYSGSINILSTTTIKYFAADNAGNQESVKTETYTINYSDSAPPDGSITINSNASYTNSTIVNLSLSCTDDVSGCAQMQFSSDDVTYSTPETFTSDKSRTLASGDGTKTVYVKFKDHAGNWSIPYSDSIILDTTGPTITGTTSSTANGYYKSGGTVNITINFSEPVTTTGLTINLNSGASITTGALSSVSSFSGTYTVGAGQTSADLSISSISGTITDSASNNTTDPTIPAGQNIADSKNIVIDTTAPVVSAGSNQTKNAQFTQTATATDTNSMTYLWTKQSGTGTVTFGTAAALSTTISADTNGTYTIRFTATDAANNSAFSDMTLDWDTNAILLNDGLVAYYPFNGNANDESGNGNNGSVNDATLTNDRFGNTNAAYNFNGTSSYIQVADSPSLHSSQIAFGIWINLNVIAPSGSNQFLIAKGHDGAQGSYYVSQNGDQFHFYIGANGIDQVYAQTTPLSLQTNKWYYVAGTYDGSGLKIYVDGVLKGNTSATVSVGNSLPLTLGYQDRTDVNYYLSGGLDDVRIYNRVLTDAEVQSLYTQGNTTPIANAGGPYTGIEGVSINLDGSGSSDSDGSIATYEWDIDNNGSYDYSSASSSQSHTYAQNGVYTVKLRVTDNMGATGEATTTATISDTSPVAGFIGNPTSGGTPLTVNFTNSSTGYDQPLTYEWDFDNNGAVDSTLSNPSHEYTTEGTYSVKLTVTDSDASSNSLTRLNYISVTSSLQPVKIGGGANLYFNSIQDAYDAAANLDSILIQQGTFTENILFDINNTITLIGGYNSDFTTVTGRTIISGNVTLNNGKVTMENIQIQ